MNDNADDAHRMGPHNRVTKAGAKSAAPHKNDAIPSNRAPRVAPFNAGRGFEAVVRSTAAARIHFSILRGACLLLKLAVLAGQQPARILPERFVELSRSDCISRACQRARAKSTSARTAGSSMRPNNGCRYATIVAGSQQ